MSAELLATLAHELRQPLGAIESIAYYLSMVLPETLPQADPKILEQLDRLQELVEQSDWILANGLRLADQPLVSAEPLDLNAIIREFVETRCWQRQPRLELAGGLVRADPNLALALIANLVTLVHQAACVVRTSADCTLELESDAPTLGCGGRLSLDSARRIVEAHQGSIECRADSAGIRIRVMLP